MIICIFNAKNRTCEPYLYALGSGNTTTYYLILNLADSVRVPNFVDSADHTNANTREKRSGGSSKHERDHQQRTNQERQLLIVEIIAHRIGGG